MSADEDAVLDMVGWAHDKFDKLLDRVDWFEAGVGDDLYELPDRDMFIRLANETDEPKLMIALLDGKDIEPILWRRLRKHGTVHQGKEWR